MPLDAYHHGTRVIEMEGGVRPIQTIQTGVIGIVATADDADPDVFPLDRPVLCAGDATMIADAGTTGTPHRAKTRRYAASRSAACSGEKTSGTQASASVAQNGGKRNSSGITPITW